MRRVREKVMRDAWGKGLVVVGRSKRRVNRDVHRLACWRYPGGAG